VARAKAFGPLNAAVAVAVAVVVAAAAAAEAVVTAAR
jgi:hypothetical protein